MHMNEEVQEECLDHQVRLRFDDFLSIFPMIALYESHTSRVLWWERSAPLLLFLLRNSLT